MYVQEAIIPIELELQSLCVVEQLKMPMEQSVKDRMMMLNKMYEVQFASLLDLGSHTKAL